MATNEPRTGGVTVTAENVGGIDRTQVTLPRGVTVLAGRNATNRTSFLQSLMAALGSEQPSLKADADEGVVELELGGETYVRTLTRQQGTVTFGGDPYLDDPELADLFAFLLENNEARLAVERGDDLREVIMQPIDTDEIDRRIDDLETEKRELDGEIDRLDELGAEMPTLESRKQSLETELEETRAQLATIEAQLDDSDVDPQSDSSRTEALEAIFADLREARSELDDVEFELETERTTVEGLEEEREQLEDDLREMDADVEDADPSRLDGRIDELRARKRALDGTVSELQSVIGFNEDMLDGANVVTEAFDGSESDGDITKQLLDEGTTTCWTCGSDVDAERIERTLERLRELQAEKLAERDDLRERIDDLTDERDRLETLERERERTERRLEEIADSLADSHDRIEELEATREELTSTVERLETKADAFDREAYSEMLDRYREANRLELEIERLEEELTAVTADIRDHEEAIAERETLVERREAVTESLADLRTRVDRIEQDAIEAFNDHIDAILAILEYENIERIWIERHEREVQEGRRTVQRTAFDLHVVRSADGTAYRDSVENLSESEREVTGLVFALAGYLVHDVHDELPFVLLDSLEAIDAERIAALVDYFEQYTPHLVVALLPDDAEALDDEYVYISDL